MKNKAEVKRVFLNEYDQEKALDYESLENIEQIRQSVQTDFNALLKDHLLLLEKDLFDNLIHDGIYYNF